MANLKSTLPLNPLIVKTIVLKIVRHLLKQQVDANMSRWLVARAETTTQLIIQASITNLRWAHLNTSRFLRTRGCLIRSSKLRLITLVKLRWQKIRTRTSTILMWLSDIHPVRVSLQVWNNRRLDIADHNLLCILLRISIRVIKMAQHLMAQKLTLQLWMEGHGLLILVVIY
jgi:hypothetical protein